MKTTELIWLGQRLVEMGRREMQAESPDVPATELIVMGDLLDHAPSTITALAQRTGYAQSRISTVVAELIKRGWAETLEDPQDGRRTLVNVPSSVRSEARQFRRDTENRALLQLIDACPQARRDEIVHALEELLDILRAKTPGPIRR